MFQITEDPSSWSLVECLAKNYKNDSIMSLDMDKVGVMAAYSDLLCVCVVASYTVNYTDTHTGLKYAAITPTRSMSTDTIESFLYFLANHYTRLHDDGSSVIRNMLEHF